MLTTLYKKNWKAHWKLLVAMLSVMTLYMVVIIDMYDPQGSDLLQSLVSLKISRELMAAFGMKEVDSTLQGFLASYLYGFLFLVVPMVLILNAGNRLVASLVDRGSMASVLSSAVTRPKVAGTQAVFLIGLIAVMALYATALGWLFAQARFPGMLDTAAFLRMNGGLFMMLLAISGVMFFASCLFNESRHALAIGAGVPVVMLVVNMLVSYSDSLGFLRGFSLFSLFRPADIAAGRPMLADMLALGGISLMLYAGGAVIFNKKDLPL